jgi:LmbE family N-acetylglucosaminyl deacetylase
MQITDAAVFYARLTKWDAHFGGLAAHTIERQIYCTLGFPLSATPVSAGQLVIDISGTLAKKVAAILCYKTQFPPGKQHVIERVETGARYLGQSAGVAAAELLTSPRPIAVADVMQTLFG